MVTWASRPLFSFRVASPTSANSSAGRRRIPYTNVKFAIPIFYLHGEPGVLAGVTPSAALRAGPPPCACTKGFPDSICYNAAVLPKFLMLIAVFALSCACAAQEVASQPPKVKVNVLNVCAPSKEEQQEIASALARVPSHPSFSADFEVDRGRSVLDQSSNLLAAANNATLPADATSADFVRIRHDLAESGAYSNVQYSFSRDQHQMVETLIFHVRDPKELLQVSIEDSASSVTSATAMLTAATPASRIKLERFGKSSVVLARCSGSGEGPAPDQSAYEPQFTAASSILAGYRGWMRARKLVPEELARINGAEETPTRHQSPSPAPGK